MDAYVAAFALPMVVTNIFVGTLAYAVVPVLIEQREQEGEARAWHTAGTLGLILTAVTTAVALLGFSVSRPLMRALQPGFSPQQFAFTVSVFQVLVWQVPLSSLVTYFHCVHHAAQRFVLPACATLAGTMLTLAMIYLPPRVSITDVAWAINVGSAAAVVAQFPYVIHRLRLDWHHREGVARCARRWTPLVTGAAYTRLDPLVDRFLASRLPTGSLAQLGYAVRAATAVQMTSSSGLSVVTFPKLAQHFAVRAEQDFQRELSQAWRFLAFLLVPIVGGLALFSKVIVRDLFERGQFTAADTRQVAVLLTCYLGFVVGAAVGDLAARASYALGSTRAPVWIGVVGFTLTVALKVWLTDWFGTVGLVLAASCGWLLMAGGLLVLTVRRFGAKGFQGLGKTTWRVLLGTSGALFVAAVVVRLGTPLPGCTAAVMGAVTYGVLMWLQGDEFVVHFGRRLRSAPTMKHSEVPDHSDHK
jgi:putative peptidoglycan lipid II flippase